MKKLIKIVLTLVFFTSFYSLRGGEECDIPSFTFIGPYGEIITDCTPTDPPNGVCDPCPPEN